MKPIIFARVADMKYYRGITELDKPYNGGSYVNDTGYADECYNFSADVQDGEGRLKCIGFVQLPGGHNVEQLHIEKIVGCALLKNEEKVEDVLVVFVSKAPNAKTMRVVGFYKNATVYRYQHRMIFEKAQKTPSDEQEDGYEQVYQFETAKENCVLLPYQERHSGSKWFVPSSSSKYHTFGFGRSNIWFAGGKGASEKELDYVEKIIKSVEDYQGENWMDKEVQ